MTIARVRHAIPLMICALLIMVAAPADAAWQDTVRAESNTSAATLTAPAHLSCLGTLAGGTLSWDAVPNATGYEVVTPLGTLGTLLNAVLSLLNGVLSFNLPSVSIGTYKVRAVIPGTSWASSYSTTTISLDNTLHLSCT